MCELSKQYIGSHDLVKPPHVTRAPPCAATISHTTTAAMEGGILDFEDDDIFAFAERMKLEVVSFLDNMVSCSRRMKAGDSL